MDIDYFLHRLTWTEADLYIKGLTMRNWHIWETTRLIVNTICYRTGAKHEAMKKFDWFKEEERQTEEELAESMERIKKMDELVKSGALNKKKKEEDGVQKRE